MDINEIPDVPKNCHGIPLAWIAQKPFVEELHSGRPWFRIIEDDGCYVILKADYSVDKDKADAVVETGEHYAWRDGIVWIEPEIWAALCKLPPPRGTIWSSERDGGCAPDDEAFDVLVEQRLESVETDREKTRQKLTPQ